MTDVGLASVLLHGFGVRYDLPISLPLYLFGASAVVVLSFVMVAIFGASGPGNSPARHRRYEVRWLRGLPELRWPRVLCRAYGVLFLIALIATGLFGSGSPDKNPAEYLLWIYFWAGLVVLIGAIGPVCDVVNPFVTLDSLVRRVTRRPALSDEPDRLRRLGLWPAIALFFSFADFELASGYSNRPALVATIALAYTVFTLAGMQAYGRRGWLEHFELFTVLFSILRRFGPIEVDGERVYVRLWGAGLLQPWPAGWDRVTFVILTLSTLALDGLEATPLWDSIVAHMSLIYQDLGQSLGHFAVYTLGLVQLTALFLIVFTAFIQLVIHLGRVRVDELESTTAFALTLVPIAFVYNLAHNYSYLTIQGQGLIPLLADPFARGWHLLPTTDYVPSFALSGAATVWYAQVVLIVVGHVIAVHLSHRRAGERFESARNVLISQYPMLLLMVTYTMCSLWILAQPITEGG
jgi:hypothetical protein